MGTILFYLTLAALLIVVLVLVVYLVGIIAALRRADQNLKQLAVGLDQISRDTRPLTEKLTTINGALTQLEGGLLAVDGHMAGVARLLAR